VDTWVLQLLDQHVFRKTDFHERPDGVVSIVAPLSHQLAETMPTWAAAIAPWAERAASLFAQASPYELSVPTRLTQRNRRSPARKSTPSPTRTGQLRVARVCAECGAAVEGRRKLCDPCLVDAKARSVTAAAARSQMARQRRKSSGAAQPTWAAPVNQSRAETMRRQRALRDAWEADHAGEHWDPADFEPIRQALADLPISAIVAATGLSRGACTSIRTGAQPCHPRHWPALANLVDLSIDGDLTT
jgi:hypothetical protein